MTQTEINEIVTKYYADQISRVSHNGATLSCVLKKPSQIEGLNEFKVFTFELGERQVTTERELREVLDDVISINPEWFYS
jgi:hypothetical protein